MSEAERTDIPVTEEMIAAAVTIAPDARLVEERDAAREAMQYLKTIAGTFESERDALQTLAQKTMDQECVYLHEIAALRAMMPDPGWRNQIDRLEHQRDEAHAEITDLKRRLALPEESGSHPYHGPTEPVPHPTDRERTERRAISDPVHEQFHRAVGDVLAGKIIPKAREQMAEALRHAPVEKPPFPVKIAESDPRRMGLA